MSSNHSRRNDHMKLSFIRDDRERFDLQELLRASAEILGSGFYSSSYKASLTNGPTIVVKRFKQMNNVGKEEFQEHMRRIGRLNHPNLIPLVAYYYRKEEKLLLQNPICFYVLHLIQLTGRSTPLFIDHQPISKKTKSSHSSYSRRIINAFRSYEQQKENSVVVKLFTSISPYETMHDEICMQVAEKRVCLLILPFHRQWRPNGMTEAAHPVRALNRHLLRTAPCSVGILIERGSLNRNNPLTSVSFYSVGIVFIEGEDDREALAYAMRMANNPNVRITLVRIMEPRKKNKNLMNRDLDGDLIHKFKVDCIQIKRHDYKEEIARDSVEMINVIMSLVTQLS